MSAPETSACATTDSTPSDRVPSDPDDLVLAASAEMLWTDLPFRARVEHLRDAGFHVEIWDWTAKDLADLATTGAAFSSMTGYVRGNLTDPDGIADLLRTAEESLEAAAMIDCPRLNLHGTGLDSRGLPVAPHEQVSGADWIAAARTLEQIAALGERYGRVFTLENLNTAVDHPGTPFARAEDTITLVKAVDSPHLRLNLDLYHAQIGEGNLIELVQRALPLVGEIQVADVPGRCEPGTGEISYPMIARALRELGYSGVVALEGWARSDADSALTAFRRAFTASAGFPE
jgi:hydroxypyruvate isomerase